MKKTCLIALLAWHFPTITMAQDGIWEPVFNFGTLGSQTVPPIAPVHLIHLHTDAPPSSQRRPTCNMASHTRFRTRTPAGKRRRQQRA